MQLNDINDTSILFDIPNVNDAPIRPRVYAILLPAHHHSRHFRLDRSVATAVEILGEVKSTFSSYSSENWYSLTLFLSSPVTKYSCLS